MGTTERIRVIGTIGVSVFVLSAYTLALVYSFVTHDESMKNLLGGGALAMAGTAVNWWLGSSKGSEKKDDVIASTVPPAPTR